MELKELEKLVAKGEDSSHQFKEDSRNGDKLAAEMVAFSNARGGKIFLGVDKYSNIVGLSLEDVERINQLISNVGSQHIRSPITVHTENVAVSGGKVVIVVSVPSSMDKSHFDKNGVIWFRSGSDKRRVNSKAELCRLFQSVGQYHADEISTKATLDALDLHRLKEFVEKIYKHDFPLKKSEQINLLRNMNLLSDKETLNLAGLLLFGKHPERVKPVFIVKAVSFPGTKISVGDYVDSEDFAGPLEAVFQSALSFISRNLFKIQGGQSVNSLGKMEIPSLVFEELLVNALIHRDYFVSAPIRLLVFTDRIEIVSPGHLPNNLTVEKIRAGNSNIRNPILVSFVAKGLLPYRGLGSGIKRALEEWPEIDFIEDREGCLFTVRIHRKPIKVRNDPITELQLQILELIRENPNITYDEVERRVDKNRTTVMRNINKMKEMGVLQRAGSRKAGFWEIVPINEFIGAFLNAPINAPITALQLQILELIKENPEITYDEIEKRVDTNRTTVMRNIQIMKQMGIIRRAGSRKAGFWEIIES